MSKTHPSMSHLVKLDLSHNAGIFHKFLSQEASIWPNQTGSGPSGQWKTKICLSTIFKGSKTALSLIHLNIPKQKVKATQFSM